MKPFAQSTLTSSATTPSFSHLLARYMNGQIAETAWKKLMGVFDAEGVTSDERMAYARFMNELLAERQKSAVSIPARDEMTDLLAHVRVR